MRIAVFIKSTTFHKGHGGLETQNKVLCEGLVKRGHAVTVFAPRKELPEETLNQNNVCYFFIKSTTRYFFSQFNKNSWYNQSFQLFSKLHNEQKFDLVISQSSAGLGIINHKEYLGIPVISISHGTTLGEMKTVLANMHNIRDFINMLITSQYVLRQYFGRQRDFILKSDKVIAVSNAVKLNLINETFIPENKIKVIKNGIDPTPFVFLKEKMVSECKNVLFIGQLSRDKGVDSLVEMFLKNEFMDINLIIAGDGPLKDDLSAIIKTTGNENRIKLIGKIPYDKIVSIYGDSSVFAFAFPTNREEGLPMVLVEAAFAGLPVVAFDKGGVSDVVINGVNGFLISKGATNSFANKILELKNDKDLVNKLSKNALDIAYKDFTSDVMIDQYEKVFNEVLL